MYYELFYYSYLLQEENVPLPRLYTLCYPYWMVKYALNDSWAADLNTKNNLNIATTAFDEDANKAGSFITNYQAAFTKWIPENVKYLVDNNYDLYKLLPQGENLAYKKSRLQWIIGQTNSSWDQIAPNIKPAYYPVNADEGEQLFVGPSSTLR